MAPDDTIAATLPRMNVPGMQTPPPQPPGLDPMEGLKNMARDAANSTRAQFAPQSPPPVAPLLGPGAGSTVLPMLQAADTYMRDKTAAAIGNANDVLGTVAQGVRTAGAAVAPVMTLGGDATRIGNELKTTGGMIADKVLGGIFGGQYQRERTNPAAGVDPFAYKGAPIPVPPTPGATPAPAAPTITPPAAAPVAGAPAPAAPGGDKFDKQVQLASLISAQNNSRTPVSNPYEGPAAGVAPPAGGVHGSIGVEGLKQQLANMQALQTPAPSAGVAGADADTETWQDKQNRQMSEKWAREDQLTAIKNANPALAATLASVMNSQLAADTARHGADASSGASMRNASLAAQSARERDAANLQATGMQVSGQDRNSQRSTNASMYGHDMHASTAMQDAMMRAQTAAQGHQVQRDTNAATNASALERTRMMVDEGRHRTDQTALAEQNKRMAGLYGFKPELLDPRFGTNAAGQRIQFGLVQPKVKKDEK